MLKQLGILIFLLFGFLQFSASAQDSLVGYWSFDNVNLDTFNDESDNYSRGTTYGAGLTAGVKGTALSFNGTSSYAEITDVGENPPTALANLGKGSISVWFKVDSIPTNYGIAPILYYGSTEMCDFFDAANQGLIIEVGHSPIHNHSERLYFTIWKNGCTFPSFCFDSNHPITEGVWYHFVAVVGEDYNTGYLNGQEMTNRRYNFGNSNYSQFFEDAILHEKMWLGKGHWDRTVQYFHGAIDELKIFNSPLSSSEVLMIYNDANVFTSNNQSIQPSEAIIYPVPSSDYLKLKLKDNSFKIKELSLINVAGQKITLNNTNNNKIPLEGISPGIYYLVISGEQESIHKKVLIVK